MYFNQKNEYYKKGQIVHDDGVVDFRYKDKELQFRGQSNTYFQQISGNSRIEIEGDKELLINDLVRLEDGQELRVEEIRPIMNNSKAMYQKRVVVALDVFLK